ncbi:hypothetical protein [Aneurinibacillus danicus]|uniref:hypothetical protein n=1 Tax=Aneurinibacillus danicus TaxID=267746 RepID=UPI0011BFB20D|nr:hypothetical protein [Aneurinibacillus danicus]
MRKTRGRCRSSFFLKEAKQPLCVAPHHTLHKEKGTFGTRLASFSRLRMEGKAFAFFHIEITLSFSSLFSFLPQKDSLPSLHFHDKACG